MKPTNATRVEVTQRQREKTADVILRIARLRVEALGLSDTPEEYIQKCIRRQEDTP